MLVERVNSSLTADALSYCTAELLQAGACAFAVCPENVC